jgi:hypothetical protein
MGCLKEQESEPLPGRAQVSTPDTFTLTKSRQESVPCIFLIKAIIAAALSMAPAVKVFWS